MKNEIEKPATIIDVIKWSVATTFATFLLALLTGCVNQSVSQFDPATGVRTEFRNFTLFNNQSFKGLRVGQKTKATETLLGVSAETNVGDSETIKAIGATMGAAFGEAAKKALVP